MFNVKRMTHVNKKKVETAKNKEDNIATVHGNGGEYSSFSVGDGSSLHEVDDCTLKVTKWLIENQKHMGRGKTFCTSSSLAITRGKLNEDTKGINTKLDVDIAVDIGKDVAKKKQRNTGSNDIATSLSLKRNFEMVFESLEDTTSSFGEDPSGILSFRRLFRKVFEECRESFNLNDFLYSLISGFLPTAWDVYTDVSLGLKLEQQEDVYTAGLCWMFVCFPPVFLIIENLAKKKHSTCLQLLLLGLGLCFQATCVYLVNTHPQVLFYPAVCLSMILCGGKFLAVFIHTSHMKQFSVHLSHVECMSE